jgi:glycosyltransferase involved in cell wall biosynthesis
MKVMIVHSRYRSAAPSGENRVVDQEGAALVRLGHEVVRFERHSDDIAGWSRPRKAILPAQVVWNPGVRRALATALREARPDVVHIHNTFPLLSAAVLYACRDVGVPAVATIHNYKLECASGDFFRTGAVCHDCAGGLPLSAIRHGCYRGSRAATAPVALSAVLHRQAWRTLVSAYIFISGAQRAALSGLDLPPERVFVRHNLIPAAVPGSLAAVSASPASAGGSGPREGPPEVIYAGRLDAAKGLRVLMAGWDRYCARSATPGLRLVIAGSGQMEGEVTAWAATRPSVRLTGQLDAAECTAAMAAARAVILPSAWEETFGLAAVEAMALGVPPVAAGHGSFTELVTDGVDGVLFRPGDPESLAQALADAASVPDKFAEYGRQARKTYEQRFDPADSVRKLTGIYQFAIANPAYVTSDSER